MNTKNINAIEKVIKELSMKDYLVMNPIINGKRKYKKHRPYTLSDETLEALEIKKQYLNDEITEEEYKAYCLRYNLTNLKTV